MQTECREYNLSSRRREWRAERNNNKRGGKKILMLDKKIQERKRILIGVEQCTKGW
jgi:hypothetical protein